VEAEAEASIEYSPKGTYKHVNIKARRTRASLHRSFPNRNGGKPEGAPRTSNSRKGQGLHLNGMKMAARIFCLSYISLGSMDCSQRSRIPTSVGVRHKASVSSVSLQMELQAKKSGSDMSVLRKCISSHSQPSKKTSVIQQRLNSAKEIQIKDLTSKVRLLETTIQVRNLRIQWIKSFQFRVLLTFSGPDRWKPNFEEWMATTGSGIAEIWRSRIRFPKSPHLPSKWSQVLAAVSSKGMEYSTTPKSPMQTL